MACLKAKSEMTSAFLLSLCLLQMFEAEEDGAITEMELAVILKTALGVNHLSVSRLFTAIDAEDTGKITFGKQKKKNLSSLFDLHIVQTSLCLKLCFISIVVFFVLAFFHPLLRCSRFNNQATSVSSAVCLWAFFLKPLSDVPVVSGALLWFLLRQVQNLCGAAPRLC